MNNVLLSKVMVIISIWPLSVLSQNCHVGNVDSQKTPSIEYANSKTDKPKFTNPLQTICPVMKGAVDRAVFIDWLDTSKNTNKRIYICCQM